MSFRGSSHQKASRMIECPCGSWEWRDVSVSTALAAHERYCPRCKTAHLLVHRGPELVGVAALPGRDLGSFRQALADLDLTAAEGNLLMAAAQSIGEVA